MACAKPYGAKVVAVATGPYSIEQLRTTDADIVVETLSEIDKIISIF